MSPGLNRALLVRTADRLRAGLARDEVSGLPLIAAITDADQRDLVEVGCGRLAAVAIRVDAWIVDAAVDSRTVQKVQTLTAGEVARALLEHVRRTDLLGSLRVDTVLVLAPGLDPVGGRGLSERLRDLLANRQLEVAGVHVELRVQVGAAYRSAASPAGWTIRAMAAEAAHHATEPLPAEVVA